MVASHADDAVANAVVRILSLDEPPGTDRLGPYLYRAAYNDMIDQAKARNRLSGR